MYVFDLLSLSLYSGYEHFAENVLYKWFFINNINVNYQILKRKQHTVDKYILNRN